MTSPVPCLRVAFLAKCLRKLVLFSELCCCLCALGTLSAQTTKGTEQTVANVPLARIQRERDEKSAEIRAEREEMKPLLDYQTQMDIRKAAIAKLAIRSGVTDAVGTIKK